MEAFCCNKHSKTKCSLHFLRLHFIWVGLMTPDEEKELIRIDNVSHTFNTNTGALPVLKNLTLSVPENGFTAIVGPSGCGKSTVTRLVAGLLKPNSGSIWLQGQKVLSPRNIVGMAFQNPVLLEWRSILKNVMLPLEIVPNSLSPINREERARALLKLVGLAGFEHKRPSELSGGMRQRASLCRALVHRPEVLILDEPFGALDAFTREDLWQIMHQLRAEEPFTGVLITHDLREAIFLADEVIVLSGRPATVQFRQKLTQQGARSLDQLYTREANETLLLLREQIKIARHAEEIGA